MSDIRKALEALESVLCDPEGKAGIHGSDADMKIIDDALDQLRADLAQPQAAQPEPSEEIQELRAQVEAWRKQCETLTNQVICCGVAARHPDATLTTRGAYAGKWNSPQAEEVRKLRAERDALLAASPQPEPSAQGEPVACVTEEMVTAYLTANDAYWKRIDGEPTKLGKWRNGTPSEATRVSLMAALASAPSTPPHAVPAKKD